MNDIAQMLINKERYWLTFTLLRLEVRSRSHGISMFCMEKENVNIACNIFLIFSYFKGCLCIVCGFIILIMDLRFPSAIANFFGVDVRQDDCLEVQRQGT